MPLDRRRLRRILNRMLSNMGTATQYEVTERAGSEQLVG
jgi:hypothetical protein